MEGFNNFCDVDSMKQLTEKEALQLGFDLLSKHPALMVQQVATLMLLFKNMSDNTEEFQQMYFKILLKDT